MQDILVEWQYCIVRAVEKHILSYYILCAHIYKNDGAKLHTHTHLNDTFSVQRLDCLVWKVKSAWRVRAWKSSWLRVQDNDVNKTL